MGEQNFERIEWKMKKKNQLIKGKIESKCQIKTKMKESCHIIKDESRLQKEKLSSSVAI